MNSPSDPDVDVRRVDGDRERWNEVVEGSPQATVLHRFEALSAMARHSGTSLVPLAGVSDDEIVGLFPAFVRSRGPVTAVLSPPPHLWVQKLGPVFPNGDEPDRLAAELRRQRFVDAVFQWLHEAHRPGFVRILTSDRIDDARPFVRNGCDVTPAFTYVTDLRRGKEELLDRFSSDARRNVRAADDRDYEVVLGDGDDVVRLMEQVARRYGAQGEPFDVPPAFTRELYDRLPDGAIRPYVLRFEGEIKGGLLAYDDGETVGRWYGGVKPGDEVEFAVNDLLDWHVMCDAIDRGRSFYDLVGAGDPRLNRYKAKFAPELATFYRVERASAPMRLLLGAYRSIPVMGPG